MEKCSWCGQEVPEGTTAHIHKEKVICGKCQIQLESLQVQHDQNSMIDNILFWVKVIVFLLIIVLIAQCASCVNRVH